jgi:hypothetical protein
MRRESVMKKIFSLVSAVFFTNIFILCYNTNAEVKSEVKVVELSNPEIEYDFAGKLCWNPNESIWEKQIVLYNNSPKPPSDHYIWDYVRNLTAPGRDGNEDWESLYYKPFYFNELCTPKIPLQQSNYWKIDFNDNSIGNYTVDDLLRDWNCPNGYEGHNQIEIIDDNNAYEGKSIKIKYPKNQYGCNGYCVNWKVDLGKKYEKLYCSYRIKIPHDFNFVKGGKLPGFAGGEANTGKDKPNGKDGWSARIMWRKEGTLSQYVYHPDQPTDYGENFEWNMEPVEKNKWHQIQTMISMNTPGKKDGIIRSWLNGVMVLDKPNIRFRDIGDIGIDIFRFASFFGGNESSWAPDKDEHLYLDDFIISQYPIIEEKNSGNSGGGCYVNAVY